MPRGQASGLKAVGRDTRNLLVSSVPRHLKENHEVIPIKIIKISPYR